MFTKQQLKEALPPTVHKSINDQVLDDLNAVLTDPDMRDAFRDNIKENIEKKEVEFEYYHYHFNIDFPRGAVRDVISDREQLY